MRRGDSARLPSDPGNVFSSFYETNFYVAPSELRARKKLRNPPAANAQALCPSRLSLELPGTGEMHMHM